MDPFVKSGFDTIVRIPIREHIHDPEGVLTVAHLSSIVFQMKDLSLRGNSQKIREGTCLMLNTLCAAISLHASATAPRFDTSEG